MTMRAGFKLGVHDDFLPFFLVSGGALEDEDVRFPLPGFFSSPGSGLAAPEVVLLFSMHSSIYSKRPYRVNRSTTVLSTSTRFSLIFDSLTPLSLHAPEVNSANVAHIIERSRHFAAISLTSPEYEMSLSAHLPACQFVCLTASLSSLRPPPP